MPAPEGWRVELTKAAVAALRTLPRDERTAVARRIDFLAESGLPPGRRGELEESGVCALPVGTQILMCVEIPHERKIVVVTLQHEMADGLPVGRLLRHTLPR